MAESKTGMRCQYMTRRIGSTVYKVRVHFSEESRETMEDKILRMIRNEAMANIEKCGIIAAKRLLYRDLRPFSVPPAGARKKMPYYTIPAQPIWYNEDATDEPAA